MGKSIICWQINK